MAVTFLSSPKSVAGHERASDYGPRTPCPRRYHPRVSRTSFYLAGALLAGLGVRPCAQEIQLESTRTRFRTSAELLEVPGTDVGLVGVHYDWLEPYPDWDDFYLGFGGFFSVTGARGGFQAAGFTAGYAHEFEPNFLIDAGLFFGGAGGSGLLGKHQGLALRPHVALERAFGLFGIRLEVASMDVAETDVEIEHVHVSLGLTSASEALLGRKRYLDETLPSEALLSRKIRTSARVSRLDPGSGSRRRSGVPYTKDLALVGLGLDYFLSESLFVPVQLNGAVGGDAAGYSSALLGLGGSLPLDSGGRLRLESSVSVGGGGGGGLDTGGGFLWQARAALQARVTKNFGVELAAGHLDFPDGHLDGAEYTASVTWTTHPFELSLDQPRSSLGKFGLDEDDVELRPMTILATNKIYMPPVDARAADGSTIPTANLVGLAIEQPIYGGFSLTASTSTAWDGSIGGYTEGLLGVAYEYDFPENEDHAFVLRGEVGAAGGGGVDVGPGLVYSATAGYRYHYSRRVFFQAEIGKLEADRGSFEAESWLLGIGVKLDRAYAP